MREKRTKSALPVYIAAAAWVLGAVILPIHRLWGFLGTIALCALGYLVAAKLCPDRVEFIPEPEPEPEPEKSYGAEADAVIAEGAVARAEMLRLRESIKNPAVKRRIDELVSLQDKITDDVKTDPADLPLIKKFLAYYPPSTIKLLNAYDRMGAAGVEGANITGSMTRIEDMLATCSEAYKKQLDALFANQALDIETDIEVMNRLLAREGLAGDDGLRSAVKRAQAAQQEKSE